MKPSTIGAMTGLFMVLGAAGCGQPGDDEAAGVEEVSGAATLAQDVNCGGPAVGQFVADEGFTGGGTISHKDVINVSSVPPFVGAQVFQTGRVGSFTYTFGPYPANWPVAIRLFFAETFFKAENLRQFNVTVQGAPALTNFDIFHEAKGKDIAIERDLAATSDAAGNVKIQFKSIKGKDQSLVSGISVSPFKVSS